MTVPAAAPARPVARMMARTATGVPALDPVWPVTIWPPTVVLIVPTVSVAMFGVPTVAMTPDSASGARYPPALMAIPSR